MNQAGGETGGFGHGGSAIWGVFALGAALGLVAPSSGAVEPPMPRPARIGVAAGEADAPGEGLRPVCGAEDILGETLPPIDDVGVCGIARPVRVTSIAGIALEPPPVLDCETAQRTRDWLEAGAKPAFGAEGGAALVGLGVVAAYVCRTVNYALDGDVSEHAFGRAIDIARFDRADGSSVAVLDGWDAEGGVLRRVHGAACGVFATVLGPDSDDLHADHFHFDVAARRRPYCPGTSEADPGGAPD